MKNNLLFGEKMVDIDMDTTIINIKKALIILLLFSGVSCSSTVNFRKTSNNPIVLKTTAYAFQEKDHKVYKNKSAIGTKLIKNQSCATDWSQFPVGTELKIDDKLYIVDDYGSALIKPKGAIPVVDIYQTSLTMMKKYGAKYHNNVQIVKMGSFEKSLQILQSRKQYAHCRTMAERIMKNQNLQLYATNY